MEREIKVRYAAAPDRVEHAPGISPIERGPGMVHRGAGRNLYRDESQNQTRTAIFRQSSGGRDNHRYEGT